MNAELPVPAKPVLLAVDGSLSCQSAVSWAADEAARARTSLVVVTAVKPDGWWHPHSRHSEEGRVDTSDGRAARVVNTTLSQLADSHPRLTVTGRVIPGDVSDGIVRSAHDAALVVVGKRGLHAFTRIIVGSTSLAVAGLSPVPVVIVPDEWEQRLHTARSVLVGVDLQHDDEGVLSFAFQRARELSVPLVALHAWEIDPETELTERKREDAASRAEALLMGVFERYESQFPEVEVVVVQRHAHAALALLTAAEQSQLVVLGRHEGSPDLAGFAFSSVTRAVLHYAECPVVVVPQDQPAG